MINMNIIVFFNFIQTKYADTNFRWKLVNIQLKYSYVMTRLNIVNRIILNRVNCDPSHVLCIMLLVKFNM